VQALRVGRYRYAFRFTFAMDQNPAGLGTVRWGATPARSGRCSLPVLDPEELVVEGVVVDLGARWNQGRRGGEEGLQLLAEQFGCLEQVRTQVGRRPGERAAYRRALRTVDQHPTATDTAATDTAAVGPVDEAQGYLWAPEPPPEDAETLMDLLHRELGAYLIRTG